MRSCSRSAIDTLQRHTLHLQVREASWLSLNRSLVGKYITKNSMNELQTIQSKISDTSGEIVMYQPDETIRLEVRLGEDTVWLSQQQMAELFGKDRTVIGRHIRNIYKEEELEWDTTCAKFAHMCHMVPGTLLQGCKIVRFGNKNTVLPFRHYLYQDCGLLRQIFPTKFCGLGNIY